MNLKPFQTKRATARVTRCGLALAACGFAAVAGTGCLDREVSPAQPNTTNVFVEQIVQDSVDKIDLLFMIDNSISMADKQEMLGQAVPELVNSLLTPNCLNPDGVVVGRAPCADGSSPEFEPIADIHIGVISSSLGGHGGIQCSPQQGDSYNDSKNDRGELIAPLRQVQSYDNGTGALGFLKWDDNTNKYNPPGIADAATLRANFTELVQATGEQGCGYEASLEAWYRFLIDPQPPVSVDRVGDYSVMGDVNVTVLEQRSWFLRPDSLVAIIMLSDENDCSIRDDGVSWLVGDQGTRIPRGTAVCRQNPNDKCCRSCALGEDSPPSGCQPLSADSECTQPAYSDTEEALNLRCFDQKRRFGIDFLYHWARYVDGLRYSTVLGRSCASNDDCRSYHVSQEAGTCITISGVSRCEYVNPLNASNPNYDAIPRSDASLVFLAGIIGVPWQDVATPESLTEPNTLKYLRATTDPNDANAETLQDRWDVLVGDPDNFVAPSDPFMIESVQPRHTLGLTNPYIGAGPEAPTAGVGASPINGHEYDVPRGDDLQYACIFPLLSERDCENYDGGCDCKTDGASPNRPLCQNAAGYGATQYYAKAYPGLRFLKVLQMYGANSIVGSVCPKITDSTQADYGYNPAVEAIIDRLKEKLKGACLPRALQTNEDGTVACQVLEATRPEANVTCDTLGRAPADEEIAKAVRKELKAAGRCGGGGQPACEEMLLCALQPLRGDELGICQNQLDDQLGAGPLAGYCYIDAMQDPAIGNPELVADCDESQRRILRIVSRGVEPAVPFSTSTLFVACQGQPLGT